MEKSREFIKAAAVAVVLPLCLTFVAFIQYSRTPTAMAVSMRADRIQQRLNEIPEKNTPAIWKEKDALQKELRALQSDSGYYTLRRTVSLLAIVAGLVAGVTGALGLGGTLAIANRSLQSREYLAGAFSRWSVFLPLLMIIQSSGLVIALAGLFAYPAANAAMRYGSDKANGQMVVAFVLLTVGVLGLGGLMVWRLFNALRSVFTAQPMAVHGYALDANAAPALWEMVGDIARRVQTAPPDNVVIGMDDGFYVTMREIVDTDGRRLNGRSLHLPLPYLPFLNREEITAIIGHELGHFAGEDDVYTEKFLPIYHSAAESLRAIERTSDDGNWMVHAFIIKPLLSVAEFLFFTFDKVVKHWSRIREIEADKIGASTSSARGFTSALLRISLCGPVVNSVLSELWNSPEQDPGKLADRLLARAAEQGLSEPASCLATVQSHPTDTHPTTRERFEALGIQPDDPAVLREATRDPQTDRAIYAELVPQSDSLASGLAAAFRRSAAQNKAETIVRLEEAIAAVDEKVFELHEKTILFVVGEIFAGALLVVFAIFAGATVSTRLFLFAVAGLLFWAAHHFYQRGRQQPAVVLTSTGIRTPGLVEELPWAHVDDYSLSSAGTNTGIELYLCEDAPEPARQKAAVSCKYKAKKHMVALTLFSLRKFEGRHVNVHVIAEEIDKRMQAEEARRVLEKPEAPGVKAG